MANYDNSNEGGLTHTVRIRFSDKDMEYLKFMVEEMGTDMSTFIRETVRADLIDGYRKVIKLYPPTKEIDAKINKIATMTGLSRPQVLMNIIIFHLMILDIEILTEELIMSMIGASEQQQKGKQQQQQKSKSSKSP